MRLNKHWRRAKLLDEAYYGVFDQVNQQDKWGWLNGLYLDSGAIFAVIASDGKLYRAACKLDGENIMLDVKDNWIEVKLDFPQVQQTRTTIRRTKDGQYRWFSISCSSVLNRVGVFDSRALFDSFIARIEDGGDYPIRKFYHQGSEFRVGQADFVARDENLLLTSGLYDDNDLAKAEVAARLKDPKMWGDSIGFLPTEEPTLVRVTDGINIPAYESGILEEISTCLEADAASLFTTTPTVKEEKRMALPDKAYQALVKLFGDDEEAAKKWLADNVDPKNRTIQDQGLLTRTQEQAEVAGDQGANAAQTFLIDEATFTTLVERVGNGLEDRVKAAVAEAIKDIPGQLRASPECCGWLDG